MSRSRLAVVFAAGGVALWIAACAEPPPTPLGAFISIDPPAGDNPLAPNLSITRGTESVISTWLERKSDGPAAQVELRMAELDGDSWSAPETVVASSRMFANWADLPSVVETRAGNRIAYWLGMLGDETYAYGVHLLATSGPGKAWQELGLLHADDSSPTEHGFVSSVVSDRNGIQMFWLDGRTMTDQGPMQLRTALVDPDELQRIGSSTILDARVCECCSTDAALTESGPIVVYRDRQEDETRDIWTVRAEGRGWSAPQRVHADGWQILGCPVNGPAIAASGSLVAVAWFTAPSDQAEIRVAFSTTGGESFSPPVLLDAERPIGRVDAIMDDERGAFVSWIASRGDGNAEVRLARISREGQILEIRTIAPTTADRAAGVPRLVRSADRIVLSWIEQGAVKAGYFPLG